MVGSEQLVPVIVLSAVLGFIVAAIIVIFLQRKPISSHSVEQSESSVKDAPVKDKSCKSQMGSGKSKHEKGRGKGAKEPIFSHPLLMTSLKGHTGSVLSLDFSLCGKYLASASEDRTVRLWKTKEFQEKDHKYARANVDLDHATCVGFSPDSKAFIVVLAIENSVRVFKVSKKKDGAVSSLSVSAEFDFPKEHKGEIIYAGVAPTGKFIMTTSKDTKMVIWNLKGEVLTSMDTLQVSNSCAWISPCGNLVASSGFTPDVKIWSVEFDKSFQFKQVSKAMELKGHNSGVYSFAFSSDSKRVATVSKDGCWRIYDTDVDYKRGQEPYLLATGNYTNAFAQVASLDTATVSISPDGFCIALAVGKCIGLINVFTKKFDEMLVDVHNDNITSLAWSTSSHELASAGGSDRSIRIWHNPTGARAMIDDLKSKLPKAKSDLVKERIQSQIKTAYAYLESFDHKG